MSLLTLVYAAIVICYELKINTTHARDYDRYVKSAYIQVELQKGVELVTLVRNLALKVIKKNKMMHAQFLPISQGYCCFRLIQC